MRIDDHERHLVFRRERLCHTTESRALAVHDDDAVAGGQDAVGDARDGVGLARAGGTRKEDVAEDLVDREGEGPPGLCDDAEADDPGRMSNRRGSGGVCSVRP